MRTSLLMNGKNGLDSQAFSVAVHYNLYTSLPRLNVIVTFFEAIDRKALPKISHSPLNRPSEYNFPEAYTWKLP